MNRRKSNNLELEKLNLLRSTSPAKNGSFESRKLLAPGGHFGLSAWVNLQGAGPSAAWQSGCASGGVGG
ncbi:MAG: hypothetical protein ACE5GE_08190, partial [Phycisphaerae bacterium]